MVVFLNKYFSTLGRGTLLFLLPFFLSSCFSEYRTHYFSEHITSSSNFFSGEIAVPSFSSGKLLVLPNQDVEETIIRAIDTAEKRIWIEIYTWTDVKLVEAVTRAYRRGVDVRVVLEGNVYGTPTINRKIFDTLKQSDIPVVYADNHRYTFTHAKFWIIDDTYFISTGNWTISFFTKNRDAIFFDTDVTVLEFLERLFLADYSHRAFPYYETLPRGIIISPTNSRVQIEHIIQETKKEVLVYVQTVSDDTILQHLNKLYQDGISVHLCVADNKEGKNKLEHLAYPVSFVRKPYLHGKFILRDDKGVFLGSQNFTKNSLENNREVGIFTEDNVSLYRELHSLFQKDCIFR